MNMKMIATASILAVLAGLPALAAGPQPQQQPTPSPTQQQGQQGTVGLNDVVLQTERDKLRAMSVEERLRRLEQLQEQNAFDLENLGGFSDEYGAQMKVLVGRIEALERRLALLGSKANSEYVPPPAYPPQPPAQAPAPATTLVPAPAAAPAPASQQVAAIAPVEKQTERKPVAGALVKVSAYDRSDRPVELLIFPAKSSAVTAEDAETALKKAGMPPVRGRAMVAMDGMLKIEGEGGKHAFSLIAEMEGRGGNRTCSLALTVSGMKVFEQNIRIGADGKGAVFGSADIEGPGLVKVSATAANCPTLVGLSLLARPPGVATLEPAQLFYLSEASN